MIDLAARARDGWKPRDAGHRASRTTGSWSTASAARLWFVTNKDAPRYRLVAIDLDARGADAGARSCPSRREPLERRGDRRRPADRCPIWSTRRADARSFDLDGKPAGAVALPGIGTRQRLRRRARRSRDLLRLHQLQPADDDLPLDVATGETRRRSPRRSSRSIRRDYAVEQRFYPSKDGTRVPMFIVRKQGR